MCLRHFAWQHRRCRSSYGHVRSTVHRRCHCWLYDCAPSSLAPRVADTISENVVCFNPAVAQISYPKSWAALDGKRQASQGSIALPASNNSTFISSSGAIPSGPRRGVPYGCLRSMYGSAVALESLLKGAPRCSSKTQTSSCREKHGYQKSACRGLIAFFFRSTRARVASWGRYWGLKDGGPQKDAPPNTPLVGGSNSTIRHAT
jgi:hypothetical protein